jgi:hypothetical protein
LTPAGNRGNWETPQVRITEEAPIPPRGKQVPEAEINGLVSLDILKTTINTKTAFVNNFPIVNVHKIVI